MKCPDDLHVSLPETVLALQVAVTAHQSRRCVLPRLQSSNLHIQVLDHYWGLFAYVYKSVIDTSIAGP
jgi:hypothetical protein